MAFRKKKSNRKKSRFLSKKKILLVCFVLVFAGIGAFMVFRSKADSFDVGFETDQYNRINKYRADNGRGALFRSDCLTRAAREWSFSMAAKRAISHTALATYINDRCGAGWTNLGENVGRGPSSQSLWDGFVNSTEHRNNILGGFTKVGVGVFKFDNYCDGSGWCGPYYYEVMHFSNGPDWWASAPFIADTFITGRVTFNGSAKGGVKIETCTGKYPVTDGNGNYAFTVSPGTGFCARVASGVISTWGRPGTNNNLEHYYDKSYEYQIAGASCYHYCSGGAFTWDRNTDGGYDFNYAESRSLALKADGQGYAMNVFGVLRPFGGSPALSSGKPGYWRNDNVARAIDINDSGRGYEVDKAGALHAFGGAPAASIKAYWPGMDAARDIKLIPGTTKGYVLDMSGGLWPFGGAPATRGGPYWLGQDLAKKFVIREDGKGGYVLDAYGGVHPFAIGSNEMPKRASGGTYWPGWNIARSLILKPDGSGGYVLDGFGALHPFAVGTSLSNKPPAITRGSYWAGWDIARDVTYTTWTGSKPVGYLLDGYGGIHKFTE